MQQQTHAAVHPPGFRPWAKEILCQVQIHESIAINIREYNAKRRRDLRQAW